MTTPRELLLNELEESAHQLDSLLRDHRDTIPATIKEKIEALIEEMDAIQQDIKKIHQQGQW